MNRLEGIIEALEALKVALKVENITLKQILVDKTLPLKYELSTGKEYHIKPRVACDPFTSLCIDGVGIVGEDNERVRNHKEWEYEKG